MLSKEEIAALRCTILEYQPLFERNRGSDCIPKGLILYDAHGGGALFWIEELRKIGLTGIVIGHLYFFPHDFSDTDTALNLADNGYPQYPPLNRREAKEIGEPKDPSVMGKNFFFSIPGL